MAEFTPDELKALAQRPASASGDQGSYQSRSMDEVLETDRYIRGIGTNETTSAVGRRNIVQALFFKIRPIRG